MQSIWLLAFLILIPAGDGFAQIDAQIQSDLVVRVQDSVEVKSDTSAVQDSTNTVPPTQSTGPKSMVWDPYAPIDLDAALMDAVKSGQANKVRALLARGADPQAKDIFDQTPLEWAMQKIQANMVDMLVGKENRGVRKRSMWGMERSYEDVVRILLEAKSGKKEKGKPKPSAWTPRGSAMVWGGSF